MEQRITSRNNPIVKRIRGLADSARERRAARMALLDGVHLIEAYVQAGGQPATLLRSDACPPEIWTPLQEKCQAVLKLVLPDALFRELSPVDTPVGVMAEAAWLDPRPRSDVPLVLLLEDIRDPGNLGSLLRSAAAAGATLAVQSKGCADAWSPKTLRGGQGAQFALPMELRVDLPEWIASHPEISVMALALKESANLFAADLTKPVGILVGNEGAGLSRRLLDGVRHRVHIPMPGQAESLNVGVAAAIALFEAVRQRQS
jgi:TrmH family RNA methyltransferase